MCPTPFSKQFLYDLSIEINNLKQVHNEIPLQAFADAIKRSDKQKEISVNIDENFVNKFLKIYDYSEKNDCTQDYNVALYYAVSSTRLDMLRNKNAQHVKLENKHVESENEPIESTYCNII